MLYTLHIPLRDKLCVLMGGYLAGALFLFLIGGEEKGDGLKSTINDTVLSVHKHAKKKKKKKKTLAFCMFSGPLVETNLLVYSPSPPDNPRFPD